MYYPIVAATGDAVPPPLRLIADPVRWRLLRELAGGDLRVRELVAAAGEAQNLVSYHLRRLRSGGLVTARRSSFDGRDTYYSLAACFPETVVIIDHLGRIGAGPDGNIKNADVEAFVRTRQASQDLGQSGGLLRPR